MSNAVGLRETQLKYALDNNQSIAATARYLHVSLNTLKKYMRLYGIPFEPYRNQSGKGITRAIRSKRRLNIPKLLEGEYNGRRISRLKLKSLLVREMILPEECAECGHARRRMLDETVPLDLDFIDGDSTNYLKENLRLLCLNCQYHFVGGLTRYMKDKIFYDPHDGKKYQVNDADTDE